MSKCLQILLPKPKFEIGYTKLKNNVFAHYCKDIIDHRNTQIRLSFRCGKNKYCASSIIEVHGMLFILTDFVNLNHRENDRLYKHR